MYLYIPSFKPKETEKGIVNTPNTQIFGTKKVNPILIKTYILSLFLSFNIYFSSGFG